MSHEGRAPQAAEYNTNLISLPFIGSIRLLETGERSAPM